MLLPGSPSVLNVEFRIPKAHVCWKVMGFGPVLVATPTVESASFQIHLL